MITCLDHAGYRVMEASGGKTGVRMAIKIQPDLVILDLMMPIMDGATITWHLKQNQLTKHIPILLLGSNIRSELAKRALDAGAETFISKSLILSDLIDTVKDYIGKG